MILELILMAISFVIGGFLGIAFMAMCAISKEAERRTIESMGDI